MMALKETDDGGLGLLNQSSINRLLDDTSVEFLVRWVRLFAEDSTQQLERIRSHITARNFQGLQIEIDSLKGIALTLGATELERLIEQVEETSHTSDTDRLLMLAWQIEDSYILLRKELVRFLERQAYKTEVSRDDSHVP